MENEKKMLSKEEFFKLSEEEQQIEKGLEHFI
jgi:hypothetical protein